MKPNKTPFLFLLLILLIMTFPNLYGQSSQLWLQRYNGPANNYGYDKATAMTVDSTGNVYVTGASVGATYNTNIRTIKYDNNGTELWNKEYNGPDNKTDYAKAIAVDKAGNVYVTGKTTRTSNYIDYVTIKYDNMGNQQWASVYNGTLNVNDDPRAIVVDDSMNVYVSGSINDDYVNMKYCTWGTIKYNSAGQQQWLKTVISPIAIDAIPRDMAIDDSANIYITGYVYGSVSSTSAEDVYIVKYTRNGTVLWTANYSSTDLGGNHDEGTAITVDKNHNVYITGLSVRPNSSGNEDFITIKYNMNGVQDWLMLYDNGSGEQANDVAVDNVGNVYITGQSAGAGQGDDYATLKYSPGGQQLWVSRFNGTANLNDIPAKIVVDTVNNAVYVTGYTTVASGTNNDYVTIKYDNAGNEIWKQQYNGTGNGIDMAAGIALDRQGNIFVTGNSPGVGSNDDYVTIKYGPLITSVNNINRAESNAFVFPNPATKQINIKSDEKLDKIELFDMQGKLMLSTNEKNLNIESLPQGLYFIKITGTDFFKADKFIKE